LSVTAFLSISTCPVVRGQSTILRAPSADVVAPHKVAFEFDFNDFRKVPGDGSQQKYMPRVVVGIGRNLEAGVNVGTVISGNPSVVYVEPNVKWQFYRNDKATLNMSFGVVAHIPVKGPNRSISELFYLNASKTLSGKHGPRITFGGYSIDGSGFGASRRGVIAGVEEPLAPKVSLVADWFSGKNRLGYVTPGLAFALDRRSGLLAGYSIGNSGRRNHGVFMYYYITF
jgi:hypothetical protein